MKGVVDCCGQVAHDESKLRLMDSARRLEMRHADVKRARRDGRQLEYVDVVRLRPRGQEWCRGQRQAHDERQ